MISFSLYPTPQDAPQTSSTAGNVIAALASFFVPGLGQLVQGRLGSALLLFLGTTVGYALWFLILPGLFALILHLVAILDAATHAPKLATQHAQGHARDRFAGSGAQHERMRFAD